MTSQEFVYIVINAVLYIGLALWYQRIKAFTVGSFLLFIWAASAGFALLYEPNNYIGHFQQIQLWPFFYMFALNLIAFYPILKFRHDKIIYFKANPRIIILLGIIIGILALLPLIENIIYALGHISDSGYDQLLSNMNERYADKTYEPLNYLSKPAFYCSRLLGFLGLNLLTLLLVSFPVFIDIKRHKWSFVGVIMGNLNYLFMSVNIFARFSIAVQMTMLLCAYIIVYHFYSPQIRKKTNKYLIIAVCSIASIFLILTIYRLQGWNEKSGLSHNKGIAVYIGQYLCEGMPNFSADRSRAKVFDKVEEMEGGVRRSLFRQKDIPLYKTQQAGYRGQLIGPQFSTWIGNFYLALGPILIFAVFIAAAIFMYYFIPKRRTLTFAQCLLIIAYLRMMILGICYNTYAVGADELFGEIFLILLIFLSESLKRKPLSVAVNTDAVKII